MARPEAPPKRRRTRLILGGLAAAIVALTALAALEHRYGPIDPTDPGWKAQVINDTGQSVRLGGVTVPVGESDIVPAPGPGGLHPTYKVTAIGGSTLGCLSVALDREQTVTVRASSMRPCPAR